MVSRPRFAGASREMIKLKYFTREIEPYLNKLDEIEKIEGVDISSFRKFIMALNRLQNIGQGPNRGQAEAIKAKLEQFLQKLKYEKKRADKVAKIIEILTRNIENQLEKVSWT